MESLCGFSCVGGINENNVVFLYWAVCQIYQSNKKFNIIKMFCNWHDEDLDFWNKIYMARLNLNNIQRWTGYKAKEKVNISIQGIQEDNAILKDEGKLWNIIKFLVSNVFKLL